MDTNITDSERILNLRKELTDYSFWYYTHHTSMVPDAQYDLLFRELLALEKEHPEMADPNSPTMRVGSNVPTGQRKVKLGVPMLSLDNVNNIEETLKFFSSVATQEVTIEMKLDGLSLDLKYVDGCLVQALTRGNSVEGADVTENARTIRTLPLVLREPVTIGVRGEVCWALSAFNAYNATAEEPFANPRNGASGSMSLKDSKEVAKRNLSFVAYSIPTGLPIHVNDQEALLDHLETLGFMSTMTLPPTKDMPGLPYTTCSLVKEEIEAAIKMLGDYREFIDFETDGLVIKMSSLKDQRDMGEGTRSPKWAAAYKFPPEIKETRLLNVILQVGKTGQVTPVAQLEPVSLGGTVVQRASLCNQDEMNRLGIDIGDMVYVQRSGEVIPKLIGLARPAPGKVDVNKGYQMPKTCPSCGSVLKRLEGMVHVYCPNSTGCKDQIYGKMLYAVSKEALDIDGCGDVTVTTLINAAIHSLADLYEAKDFTFLSVNQAKKLKAGLEKAKSAPLWRKLVALSIEDVGKTRCQDLTSKFNSLVSMVENDESFAKVSEILGKVGTASFMSTLDGLVDDISRLEACGFKFEEEAKVQGPLSGKSFCITGSLLSGSRDTVSALISHHGGTMKGTVTKKCDFLVMGADGGLNKASAAAKYGTQVIDEAAVYQMIGIPMTIGGV